MSRTAATSCPTEPNVKRRVPRRGARAPGYRGTGVPSGPGSGSGPGVFAARVGSQPSPKNLRQNIPTANYTMVHHISLIPEFQYVVAYFFPLSLKFSAK